MGLLDLPAELRLRIYDFLPELIPGRYTIDRSVVMGSIGPRKGSFTPAICRASHVLRAETLPALIATTQFSIRHEDDHNVIQTWLDLMDTRLKHVKDLQLSRHWRLDRPTRGVGHVGFYISIRRHGNQGWDCKTGSYPTFRDVQQLRNESLALLLDVVKRNLATSKALTAWDVYCLVAACDVLANHPVQESDYYNLTPREQEERKYPPVWLVMQQELLKVDQRWRQEAEPRKELEI